MGIPEFLLVDDSPEDALLLRRVFTKARILNPLPAVRSGEEAMLYLGGVGQNADRSKYPLPALVLLDLIMPGIDGLDVLRWVRQQPELRGIRVVAITGSENPADMESAFKAGADSVLRKPLDFERLLEITLTFGGYWAWLEEALEPLPATTENSPAP